MKAITAPIALLALLLSSSALAAEDETVTLANGTVYRGALVEKVPNSHVTIKLATGNIVTVQWSELAPAPTAEQRVRVEVRSENDGARLERKIGTSNGVAWSSRVVYVSADHWEQVCVLPCSADASPTDSYRLTGDGLVPSREFTIPRPMKLTYSTSSLGRKRAGWATFAVGAGSLLLGTSFILMSPAAMDPKGAGSNGQGSGLMAGGIAAIGIGAVAMVVGLLIALPGTTSVTDEGGAKVANRLRLTPDGMAF